MRMYLGPARFVINVKLIKENPHTAWVQLFDGRTIKRNKIRDFVDFEGDKVKDAPVYGTYDNQSAVETERSSKMDNFRPSWITKAQKAIQHLWGRLCNNNKGEVVIPFIDSVAEESRPAVTNFITNTGATSEDIQGYSTFDEFLTGYKPKAAAASPGDWTSALPEDQRSILAVKGWKTPSDMLKSYTDIEKLMGHEKIAMPRKDKNGNYEKGELERVMASLGMPKDAKEYKTSEGFKLPDGIEIDPQVMLDFKTKAQKVGLLPHQFAFMMDELSGILHRGQEAEKVKNETAYNDAALALRTKYGAAYAQKKKLANSVLRNFADKERGAEIAKKYGNDPAIVELLATIGENLSEEALTRVNMTETMMSPEAAQIEINKIKGDQNHPYFKSEHPEHGYWVKRMTELYKMLR